MTWADRESFEWSAGKVWRSELGGWVSPQHALAEARRRFRTTVMVGLVEIGLDPDPGYRPRREREPSA